MLKYFFSALLFAIVFTGNSIAQVNLNNGLKAYYPFNGNANDASGNNHNGIIQGNTTLTSDRFGNLNSAYYFDGVNSRILVHDSGTLSTPAFSVCYYFNTVLTSEQVIVGKIAYTSGNAATYNSSIFHNSTSPLLFTVVDPAIYPCNQQVPGTYAYSAFAPTPIQPNEWHCVTNTFDNGTQKLYIDGLLVKQQALSFLQAKNCSNTDFLIGSWWQGDLKSFKGTIDDVRFYNRAINQEEVSALCSQTINTTGCTNWLQTPSLNSSVGVGDLDVPGNKITVEASFYSTSIVDGDIVTKHNSPADVNYLLRPNDASITTTSGFYNTPAICGFELNKRYHVAMVYDGSTLKFYRNGYLMSKIAATGNLIQNNWKTKFGWYDPSYWNSQFVGYINEVRIWNTDRPQDSIKMYMDSSLPNPATQNGLMAYYTFDNLVNKQGNSTWNGTIVGSAAINATVPACDFTTDSCGAIPVNCPATWLSTPSNPSYAQAGQVNVTGTKLTVEAVFNRTATYSGGRLYAGDLVSKHNSPADCNYLLRPNSAEITTTNGYFITPPVCDIELNKTYHAAMVYDGSTLKFYRNGYLMSQVAATGNLIQNNWKTRIGYFEPQSFNTNFIGFINEVRIWNKDRTQQELQNYMNSSLPGPASQPGLLAYFTFTDLVNKQGNTAFNATLGGSAAIGNVNSNCSFAADSCMSAPVNCDHWLHTPSVSAAVNIGDLDISGNQLTVEALINRTDPYLPGGGNNTEGDIVSKHNDFSDINYLLRPNHAYITTSTGFHATPDICDLQLNKTYHVAMVYDGTTLKFYRDGLLMSQVAASGNLIQNNWKTRIGHYDAAFWTTQFLGYINEVKIWNVARSQAQIKANMNFTLPDPAAQTGLLAYYQFDNLINKQGNTTYNGLLNGAAVINISNPVCALNVDSCSAVTPVTITSFFTQVKDKKRILVNWHTDEEYGIVKYLVQRSLLPNSGFETIGTVSANSNKHFNDYSFNDNQVKPNCTYFYRLQIIENTGNFKYSVIKSERISLQSMYTLLFPNPTYSNADLTVGNYSGSAVLHVFNNLGQVVFSKQLMVNNTASIKFDLSNQPAGSYWIQLQLSNEKIIKKIIKL